jgi:hypothetical protein
MGQSLCRQKLTTALLDRLTHHAHILTTRGDSFRTNKRKGDTDSRSPPGTNKKNNYRAAPLAGKRRQLIVPQWITFRARI